MSFIYDYIVFAVMAIVGISGIWYFTNYFNKRYQKHPTIIMFVSGIILTLIFIIKPIHLKSLGLVVKPSYYYYSLLPMIIMNISFTSLLISERKLIYRYGQKVKCRKSTSVLMKEITDLYNKNKIVADDKYKGSRLIIIGKIVEISESITNTENRNITVTLNVKVDKKTMVVYCAFDKSHREILKKFSTGNDMVVQGKFINSQNLEECEIMMLKPCAKRKSS